MASNDSLNHLGIILDGNRRWAKKRGKSAVEGHREGYRNLKKILKVARELNIDYVSAYVFSTENWNRSKEEVQGLLKLLKWAFTNELDELTKEGAQFRWIGSRDNVPADLVKVLENAEEKTKNNSNGVLGICFNYGGHNEIAEAARAASEKGEITEETIAANLFQPDIPPIDLLIRTSGEKRISNFMLWRMEYAELAFTDTLWPDFNGDELRQIVDEYLGRNRRFGA